MNAYDLLAAHKKRFKPGSAYWDVIGERCGPEDAYFFDLLGCLSISYAHLSGDDRRTVTKRVFDLCRARHGHTHLGKLDYEESLELLRGAHA